MLKWESIQIIPFVWWVAVLYHYDDDLDFPFLVDLSIYIARTLLLNHFFYIISLPRRHLLSAQQLCARQLVNKKRLARWVYREKAVE